MSCDVSGWGGGVLESSGGVLAWGIRSRVDGGMWDGRKGGGKKKIGLEKRTGKGK
jgi:hypothetical protein